MSDDTKPAPVAAPPWGDRDWKAEQAKSIDPKFRNEKGHFIAGMGGGNPAGPKKGTRPKTSLLAEELHKEGSALLAIAIAKAKAGDVAMLNLCLSRLVPVPRARGDYVKFKLNTKLPITEQAAEVVQAVADGSLDVQSAQIIMQCLANLTTIAQGDEVARQLAELYDRTGGRSTGAPRGGMTIVPLDADGNLVQ